MTTEGPAEEQVTGEQAREDEEWTTDQVLAFLAERGRKITPATWYAYVSRKQAPAPTRRIGRTPVWSPESIGQYLRTSQGTAGRPRKERS
jgi:hypothetical protein